MFLLYICNKNINSLIHKYTALKIIIIKKKQAMIPNTQIGTSLPLFLRLRHNSQMFFPYNKSNIKFCCSQAS